MVGVLGLAGGAWLYAHPPTTTVPDRTATLSLHGETHTSALVRGSGSIYPSGTRVHDRAVYFRASSPNVTLDATTDPKVADHGVTLTQTIAVRRTVTHDGTTIHRTERVLASSTASNASVHTTATLDVSAIQNRTAALEARVGDAGSVRTRVLVTLTYQTPRHRGVKNATTSIHQGGAWYSLPTSTFSVSRARTTPTVRTLAPNWPVLGALGAGGALSVLLALWLGVLYARRYRGADPEPYRHAVVAYAYREWITQGDGPVDPPAPVVSVASLSDLVDVAIDSNRRVVRDAETGTYYVLDDVATYAYEPSAGPTDVSEREA